MATAQNQPVLETQPAPQPAPRRKSKFWRVLGISTLAVVAGATAYGTLTPQGRTLRQDVTQATNTMWQVQQNPNLIFDNNVDKNRVNILLIGEDRNWVIKDVLNPRTGKKAPMNVVDDETPPRSDTMIVISLDRQSNVMRMVSFPRDARVRYTDLKGRRHRGKMNSVYATGGQDPKMREEVLKNFFRNELGLRIDRVARIRIEGFTGLIDKVGGLDINVDGALMRDRRGRRYRGRIDRTDNWGQWKVELEPGMQHLNGTQGRGLRAFSLRFGRRSGPHPAPATGDARPRQRDYQPAADAVAGRRQRGQTAIRH